MFIEVGSKVSVEDLLKGMIVQSGNDASIALAEGVAGDEDTFSRLMTARAHEMGMKDSQFRNASGWPDPDHYSTAHDLALLAQRLIVDFPHEYALYAIKEFTYGGITQANRNPLLYRDIGVDGIKTGHTDVAGYGLMASGEREGRRVVMVVNGLESEQARAMESTRLMSWALNSFENVTIIPLGQIVDKADVVYGQSPSVDLTVNRDVVVTVPKGERRNIKLVANYNVPLRAPVQKGDVVGTLDITIPQVGEFKVPLVAATDVKETGFFGRIFENIRLFIQG